MNCVRASKIITKEQRAFRPCAALLPALGRAEGRGSRVRGVCVRLRRAGSDLPHAQSGTSCSNLPIVRIVYYIISY